jgi:hypothetical protein
VGHDAAVIAIKAFLGGTMVTAFAVVGHVLRPKSISTVFALSGSSPQCGWFSGLPWIMMFDPTFCYQATGF